jgi:predicted transcriptional regulator
MTRAALHALIDQLPESELDATARLLDAARLRDFPLLQALLADEEEMEPGDAEAIAEAGAEIERGETVTEDEVKRRLGIA